MKEITLGRNFGLGPVPSLMFKRDVSSIIFKRNKPPLPLPISTPARDLYYALARPGDIEDSRNLARTFLDARLGEVASRESDLPQDIEKLPSWLEQRCAQVRCDYRAYLADRHDGQKPRYFTCKSHALHFLQSIAPSRMVEGAWLYGFLRHWREARFAPLCRIYLKNLGDGDECFNQVRLYQKLLDHNGCADWRNLDDKYYIQGAIRLALGHDVDQYLPEIIGFNLGYEQASLPMLIAAYELSELEVQPHYFTLHATEDDACIASAIKLLQPLLAAANNDAEKQALLQRVNNGYKLHRLGLDIPGIVAAFDLQQAFLAVMQPCAAYLERVYRIDCMERGIRGRWPDSLPLASLLQRLCNQGWMQPGEEGQTRLWQVLERGHLLPQGYQQQVLVDWLGYSQEYGKRLRYADASVLNYPAAPAMENIEIRQTHLDGVDEASGQTEIMECMIRLMSPLVHHTQEGLKAARVYKSILDKGSELYSQHYAFFLMRDQI
ncbi:iron-containing redox enzyme family protein [Methylobacillus arboreus]|uniref:iron-containing redox enzyme family protein n=1 Tax=Methylobacillus arboreus TaxID=755170 RepID=UPI001E44ABBF|nr:iron-containing redox enzyme family protein [Methylobacillus arboreus]MCB5191494.1 iron-containing redox enzyme family protein [Methylobacillus arboreus]